MATNKRSESKSSLAVNATVWFFVALAIAILAIAFNLPNLGIFAVTLAIGTVTFAVLSLRE